MKIKYIALFLLAFAVCAGWNLLFDSPKINKSATEISTSEKAQQKPQDSLLASLRSFDDHLRPYVDFRQAMDGEIHKIPVYTSIGAISKPMRQAIVATEDRRFYDHGAIDPIGIIRATLVNVESGETVEGGSTLSQQAVKNVFLSQDRTLTRKAQELLMAFLLEHNYSKDEILEIYLNTAYFGANATGIDAAARTYFHTAPEDLDIAQSAMLAGLVQAPSYYNPLENYKGAKERQKIVLQLMREQDYISKDQEKAAVNEDLGLSS